MQTDWCFSLEWSHFPRVAVLRAYGKDDNLAPVLSVVY